MPHYPHMMFEDVEVWTRFLNSTHPVIFDVWYDVHVGKAVPVPAESSEILHQISQGVSRKRIDVVCRTAEGYWVVEVKPYGNMVALGQALGYWGLFMEEFEVPGRVRPVVVCDVVDPDLSARFAELGVKVFETGYRPIPL